MERQGTWESNDSHNRQAAFAFLRNTDALIIDNLNNGGGDPNTVALYVS